MSASQRKIPADKYPQYSKNGCAAGMGSTSCRRIFSEREDAKSFRVPGPWAGSIWYYSDLCWKSSLIMYIFPPAVFFTPFITPTRDQQQKGRARNSVVVSCPVGWWEWIWICFFSFHLHRRKRLFEKSNIFSYLFFWSLLFVAVNKIRGVMPYQNFKWCSVIVWWWNLFHRKKTASISWNRTSVYYWAKKLYPWNTGTSPDFPRWKNWKIHIYTELYDLGQQRKKFRSACPISRKNQRQTVLPLLLCFLLHPYLGGRQIPNQ